MCFLENQYEQYQDDVLRGGVNIGILQQYFASFWVIEFLLQKL